MLIFRHVSCYFDKLTIDFKAQQNQFVLFLCNFLDIVKWMAFRFLVMLKLVILASEMTVRQNNFHLIIYSFIKQYCIYSIYSHINTIFHELPTIYAVYLFSKRNLVWMMKKREKKWMYSAELQPAPPVGFNLTFMCPEGEVCLQKYNLQNTNSILLVIKVPYLLQTSNSFIKEYNLCLFHIDLKVFDHDWFATPFVMLTCQVSAEVYSHRRTFDLSWFRALGYLTTPHGKATVVFYVSPIWFFQIILVMERS